MNAADRFGCTPLHFACAYDTTGVLVKYLLLYGADPTICTLWPPVAAVPDGPDSQSVGSVSHDYGSEFAREPEATNLRQVSLAPSSYCRVFSFSSVHLLSPLFYICIFVWYRSV